MMSENGGHLGSAILHFLLFPEPSKPSQMAQKVIKTDRRTSNDLKMQNLAKYCSLKNKFKTRKFEI